jgi:hypothetical protein
LEVDMQGDSPVSWLMFFTLASGVFIIAGAFIYFLRSQRNRDIAAEALGGDNSRVGATPNGAAPELIGFALIGLAVMGLLATGYARKPTVETAQAGRRRHYCRPGQRPALRRHHRHITARQCAARRQRRRAESLSAGQPGARYALGADLVGHRHRQCQRIDRTAEVTTVDAIDVAAPIAGALPLPPFCGRGLR